MISYFSIVVLMVSGVELILAIRSSDNTLISLVKFLSIISPPFGEIITKYDNFIKERKTVIDYDKQLDLEILFMEMFIRTNQGKERLGVMKTSLLFTHKQYHKYTTSWWNKLLDLIFEEAK